MTCAQKGNTKESKDKTTVENNAEDQGTNEQYSLNTCSKVERHNRIFQNYVIAMHTNFWRKRPLLLDSLIQSSNSFGSINKLRPNPSEEESSLSCKVEIENEEESLTRKNDSHALIPIYDKQLKESMLIVTNQNVKLNSTNANAA